MDDMNLAKEIFNKENLSLIIVKNGEVIYKSKDRGIKPLYIALIEKKENLESSVVVDKIIGKSAAMLLIYGKVEKIYTNVISKDAINLFNRENIEYAFNKSTSNIQNRNNTGLCPMEIISSNIDDVNILLEEIKKFLKL